MATDIETADQRVTLEGTMQSQPIDSVLISTPDGRPWLLKTMPCEEVWAFTYRLGVKEPQSQTRMLAEDLPLPWHVLAFVPSPSDASTGGA